MIEKKDELKKIAKIWQEIDCFISITEVSRNYNNYVVQNKSYFLNAKSLEQLLKFGYITIDFLFDVPNQVRYLKKKDFVYSVFVSEQERNYWRDDYHYNYAANRRRASRRRGDNVPS